MASKMVAEGVLADALESYARVIKGTLLGDANLTRIAFENYNLYMATLFEQFTEKERREAAENLE